MIKQSNALIIGSSGRNSGKTEYACRIVSNLAKCGNVTAVKVTTVRESGGCPRGGVGCGVCGNLQAPYCLEEETQSGSRKDTQRLLAGETPAHHLLAGETPAHPTTQSGSRKDTQRLLAGETPAHHLLAGETPAHPTTQSGSRKDTQRLLAAGATNVFWLRVHKQHLAEGLAALFARIPSNAPVVIESNSARLALEPGLFLIIRDSEAIKCKDSCAEVLPLADIILDTDGRDWSLNPERVNYVAGQWRARWQAGAIILAGGASRRMGRDKALLPFGGMPLIQYLVEDLRLRFDTVLVGAGDSAKYSFLGLPIIADETPNLGPLEGLRVCLAASVCEWNFVTACDVPCVSPRLLSQLFAAKNNVDVVLPVSPYGREPLLALYRRDAYRAAAEALVARQYRIGDMLSRLRVREIRMDDSTWYHNLNTPAEYEKIVMNYE